MSPRLTDLVQQLPASVPFVGPETQERARGRRFRARIGANENGFGPSPLAVEAMRRAAGDIWKYADPENRELRERIAVRLGVRSENVIVGEGIDGLLGLTVRLTVGPGAKVVTSLGAYPTFNFHVDGFGGELVRVPYVDDREDWHALLGAARAVDAPLIYLANPDNPMGTYWPAAEIEAFVTALPERALLCLDEAYVDFMDESLMPRIDVEDSRVIRFRTFSKAYGMAGARIGYALGAAAVIAEFEKIRNHFGVNLVAQAGALASLADAGHLPRIRLAVAAARARIGEIVARHGLVAIPSATNFVAVDTGRDGGFARRLLGELIARDVFVRMPGVAPLDRTIRIGCGRDEELDVFAAELPAALEAARSI